MAALTLATSVTMASGNLSSAEIIVFAVTSGGTQTMTKETLSSGAICLPAPKSIAREFTAGEESSSDTSTFRLRRDNPMLVPSNPAPMMCI
jgi:hypothetical protein